MARPHLYRMACAVSSLLLVFCAPATAQFETRATVPVGREPNSIAVGDFDHDGRLDIAIAQANTSQIAVLLGNGDGTFKPPVNYGVGPAPLFIVTADLDHDGNLDLVIVSLESTITILLGNGDGTFHQGKNLSTTASPRSLVVGDFNGDGIPDLAIADFPYVSVMLGNGDGTFQASIDTLAMYSPITLGIGDFNGDHKLDLAVGGQDLNNPFEMEILLGNGDGTFQQGAIYPVAFTPESIAVADFRGNGMLDVTVAAEFGVVTVFLGNGDGTFQSGVQYSPPNRSSTWVAVADLNGDGKPDMAVAGPGLPGFLPGVNIFLGNGDGTFQPGTFYRAGAQAFFVAIGDFNGDQQPDLVATDYLDNHIVSLLNTGVVSLLPTTPVAFSPQIIGTASTPQFVTLTNTGSKALSISAISVQGQFSFRTTCGASIAPGGKCLVGATFKPLAIGIRKGTITIVDSASSKPQIIALTGEGTVVDLSPKQLTFPLQRVGTKSATQVVTVTNKGSSAVTVNSITTGGYDLTEFTETNNCTSQQLAAGATCTVAVTFAPKAVGERTATLIVNDTGGGAQTVSLQGKGAK
jgi:hypothetical protein